MKKFFETACTVLLFAALLIMVGNYFENKADEPADDPIVETPVEDEIQVLSLTIDDDANDITIQYEEGMTWAEWFESEYHLDSFTYSEDDGITCNNLYLVYDVEDDCTCPIFTDAINSNLNYYLSHGDE